MENKGVAPDKTLVDKADDEWVIDDEDNWAIG
jgi:hypothetical protein